MGPALQEEGGSLCIHGQPTLSTTEGKSLETTAQRRAVVLLEHPALEGGRASKRQQTAGVAEEGRGGHVPTEVCELLVDALEGHGVVWCAICGADGGVVLRRECGWAVEEVMKPVNVSGVERPPTRCLTLIRRHTPEAMERGAVRCNAVQCN